MANAKTIELFLVDGTISGIVTVELSNWSGKAIKIPRKEIKKSKREDITLPGVYFLLREGADGSTHVYIGEGENVKDRLVRHINAYNTGGEEYYWANAIMFVDRALNKTLIRYLENRIYVTMKSIGKYKVLTKNTYKNTIIKESQIATMEEFISNVAILLKPMGYDFLDVPEKPEPSETILYCKGNGAVAKGFVSANGFNVLEGSMVSDSIAPSFASNKAWYNKRKELEENGTISNKQLTKDCEFTSPSAASSIVLGRPSNGQEDWKNAEGLSLKEINKNIR